MLLYLIYHRIIWYGHSLLDISHMRCDIMQILSLYIIYQAVYIRMNSRIIKLQILIHKLCGYRD